MSGPASCAVCLVDAFAALGVLAMIFFDVLTVLTSGPGHQGSDLLQDTEGSMRLFMCHCHKDLKAVIHCLGHSAMAHELYILQA